MPNRIDPAIINPPACDPRDPDQRKHQILRVSLTLGISYSSATTQTTPAAQDGLGVNSMRKTDPRLDAIVAGVAETMRACSARPGKGPSGRPGIQNLKRKAESRVGKKQKRRSHGVALSGRGSITTRRAEPLAAQSARVSWSAERPDEFPPHTPRPAAARSGASFAMPRRPAFPSGRAAG